MCIISGLVHTVSATKIFVCPSQNGRRQLTVYQNAVDAPTENLMCLPVPNPTTVQFETVPDDLMVHCARSIQREHTWGRTLGISNDMPLTVVSHGSYDVVLAPSISALTQAPAGFTVEHDVRRFLQEQYGSHMGILLCRLKSGHTTYTPFAYSHELLEDGSLFVPTKHYHTHMANPDAPLQADWDHEIYSYMTMPSAHKSQGRLPMPYNCIPWASMPAGFKWSPERPLHLLHRVGDWPNMDIVLPLA